MNKLIKIDDNSPLLSKNGMSLKVFSSDYRLVRFNTMMITQNAPPCIKNVNLLEQQISEVIKNAAKHGNSYDSDKKVKVWYKFTHDTAHLIVEDEGHGFQEIEKWNQVKMLRDKAFIERDFSKMAKYAIWKGKNSSEDDGGNSLFAAIEYWNEGVVFNHSRNTVALKKSFLSCSSCNYNLAIS